MEATPKAVETALLSDGEEVDGIRLRELTLATLLLLRKIESPLVCRRAYDQTEWVVTLYCLARPAAECRAAHKAGRLEEDALAWADGFAPAAFELLCDAAGRILDRAFPFEANDPPDGDTNQGNPAGAPGTEKPRSSGAGRSSTSGSPTT